MVLETGGGMLECRRVGPMQISVEMGPMSTNWRDFPVAREIDMLHVPAVSGLLKDGLAVWVGNPHVVYFVDSLAAVDVAKVAPTIQNDPLFPEGVNVGVAEMVDPETIRLAVWERPGILTGACGTGACVAAFAARLRGLTQSDRFTVHLPAGPLTVELSGDRAVMAGPVAYCCRGFVDCD
jgi:diaminopimelate epimerase